MSAWPLWACGCLRSSLAGCAAFLALAGRSLCARSLVATVCSCCCLLLYRFGRCPTLQSTGHAPASRVMPVISNVGHHGRFGLHSLRSALNQMHSLFSASFHCGESAMACLLAPFTWVSESFAGSFFTLSTALVSVGASRESRFAMRSAERSQLVGAAGCGSSLLSLRAQAQAMLAKSSNRVSGASAACLRVMPNPSINRTCPGKPCHAGFLKR